MSDKVSDVRERLTNCSTSLLHMIYNKAVRFGIITPPQFVIPYYCKDDKINYLCQYLEQHTYSGDGPLLTHIKHSLANYSMLTVPEVCFDWIDPQNHRQSIFLWKFIQSLESNEIGYFANKLSIYTTLGMPPSPSSAGECLELARGFFEILECDQTSKTRLIFEAKTLWENKSKFKHKMLRKLESDNPELTSWFDDYAKKNAFYIWWPQLDLSTFREKLPLVLSNIDNSVGSDAEKTIFLDKAYSALAGKKFRQKSPDQKGANVWLGAEQVRMLSLIAKKKKISERDTLLSLINDAYLKTGI